MIDIHASLHALVLRVRWQRWHKRQYDAFMTTVQPGLASIIEATIRKSHHDMLSNRLTEWRPVWCEIHGGECKD
jgi:hypothetical protein